MDGCSLAHREEVVWVEVTRMPVDPACMCVSVRVCVRSGSIYFLSNIFR